MYLATRPEAATGWKGAAWTASAAERREYAIAVDVMPRKSGRWNKGIELSRDESPCESQDRFAKVQDAFARLRPRVCEGTDRSPALFTGGLRVIVDSPGGPSDFTKHHAVCIEPGAADAPAKVWGREGCNRYAGLMATRGEVDRAATYRRLACHRGYRPACASP